VEGDRIFPLESHRQPLEQVCCFPGVFRPSFVIIIIIITKIYIAHYRAAISALTVSVYAAVNNEFFSSRRNIAIDKSGRRGSADRQFHAAGPATAKLRSP